LVLPPDIKKSSDLDHELLPASRPIMIQVTIAPSCISIGRSLVELDLGKTVTITSIERDSHFIHPEGIDQD
jgi:Trk K+ transport system NAD-binding subunit